MLTISVTHISNVGSDAPNPVIDANIATSLTNWAMSIPCTLILGRSDYSGLLHKTYTNRWEELEVRLWPILLLT